MDRPTPRDGCCTSMRSARSSRSVRSRADDDPQCRRAAASDVAARPLRHRRPRRRAGRISRLGARRRPRKAGVRLRPPSPPGRDGIGDLGDELVAFLDWARSAGMKIWQLLPLNPPGYGNSPYGCHSSYAGNPLVISPDRLVADGLLPATAVEGIPKFPDDHVDFDRVTAFKNGLLRESWEHFNKNAREDHRFAQKRFQEDNKWLDDWAMYAALKKKHNDARWTEWPHAIAIRDPAAMSGVKKELATEIRYQKYIQFLFFRQWAAIREAADARGIDVLGDVPIYVAGDSADVWANRELFQLDENGEPTVVAGVPPDYF